VSTNYTRGTIKKNEKLNHISSHVPCQYQISEYAQSDGSGGYFGVFFYKDEIQTKNFS